MNAAFLDFATMGDKPPDTGPLLEVLPDLRFFPTSSAAELDLRIRDAEFLLLNKVRLNADSLQAASKLRFIGLAATGTDNVDLAAAKACNVAVANIRAYCTSSVVEHVFGSLLVLTHSLNRVSDDVARGRWQQAKTFCLLNHPIRELAGLRLGVVGYGTLGKAVADMAEAFGMQLLVARRRGAAATSGDGRLSFEDMLAQADVISLHCPLNAETEGLIGSAELSAMKNDALLVNTARGGLVDSAALVAALEAGSIGGAAIDVLAEEPPVNGDPLLDYCRDHPLGPLLLTPHVAWATREARQNALREMAANVSAFQRGAMRNRVV